MTRVLPGTISTETNVSTTPAVLAAAQTKLATPNIIYILADDLGYGDVKVLNPHRGKIPTPAIDRLASQGMIFTDAHANSAVCTPTRYGILTGRYAWRTKLQSGVLWGYEPPLIERDRETVPQLLKRKGYTTACIGKWHLGMDIPLSEGMLPQGRHPSNDNVAWNEPIHNGPTARGFDYYFGISASLDMSPLMFIEDDRFVGEAVDSRYGKKGADFEGMDVLPELGRRSVAYIERQSSAEPFFLYVPLTSPHTPILPTEEWQGRSEIGAYGDFVMQTDAIVGDIVDAVDRAGLGENTIIIVTSDNGCSKFADIDQMIAKGHYPSGPFRGSKADIWEGGHRIPFIVRWPATVQPGSRSDQTICLTDLMATCAALTASHMPSTAGEDSVSFLPALTGQPYVADRKGVVHHSIDGHFAYREGKWKLVLAKGSGGWTSPVETEVAPDAPNGQLYDMTADPSESNNLFDKEIDVVERLLGHLRSDIERGRSTPGDPVPNDIADIVLWKTL